MIKIKPKDRDFIETIEGYLFCVVGYLHPNDGYTAYLKYVPSETGKWARNGVRYSRSISYYQVSQVENTYQFLKQRHPEYILECPVRNIEVSWVPKNRVKKYYHPQDRLREIKEKGPRDSLEEKLLRLTDIFEEKAGIEDSLGVTGSILTKTHNPEFSDMDIIVNGLDESYMLKEALLELKSESNEIKGISEQEKEQWDALKSEDAKKKFLFDFWRARDLTPDTPVNEFKREYFERVKKANANFTNIQRKGWKTDRGRVLLIYGEPSEIERYPNQVDTKPYEIWHYNELEGGVIFVFADLTGFSDYTLINSTKRGELSDPDWQRKISTR